MITLSVQKFKKMRETDCEPIKASDDEFDESLDQEYLSQVIRS